MEEAPGATLKQKRLSQRFSGILPFSSSSDDGRAPGEGAPLHPSASSLPTPLLGMKSRSISSAVIGDSRQALDKQGKMYFAYIINVASDNGTWTVEKRYSQFSDFYEELRDDPSSEKIDLSGFLFPNKSLLHNSDLKTLERRRAGFQHLLDLVLEQNPSHPGFLRFLAPTLQTPSVRLFANDMPEGAAHDDNGDLSNSSAPDAPSTPSGTAVLPPPSPSTSTGRVVAASISAAADDSQPVVDFPLGLVRIKKVEATNLKKVEILGENDAFVTFAFDNWRGRTSTHKNAGDQASWDTEGDEDFSFDASSQMLMNTPLRVAVFDDNDLQSDILIGKGSVYLTKLLAYGLDSEITVDVVLKDKKYLSAGSVRITLDVVMHPETLEENLRKSHEGGIVFAGFYTVLLYIGYVLYKLCTFDYDHTWVIFLSSLSSLGRQLIYYAQAMVFFSFFFVYIHRILGYSVTKYLHYLMSTPTGAFNMNFDWISLRLGLDESEIVLKNFIWKNPAIFKKSPYFVKVQRLGIRFQLESVFRAIKNNTSIDVSEVEIDGVSVYIERRTKEGLNLWACLGSGDEDKTTTETSIEASVVQNVSSAMKFAQASEDGEAESEAVLGSSSNFMSKLGFKKEASKSDENSISRMDGSDSTAIDPKFDIPLESQQGSIPAQSGVEVKTSAWGVPFTFIVNRLDIINITAYVQDYLNATHSSYNSLNAIKISRIEMRKRDLATRVKQGGWKGVFLDDLVWKVIGELVSTLLASNSGSLALIAASAAANNTASAAISTTLKASKGIVESLHNYNPSAVMSNAYKRASTMLASPINVEQEASLREMGVTGVQVHIIRARNVTRKSTVPDSVYLTASLVGGVVSKSSSYSTYTRSCEKEGTAVLDETAVLTPLASIEQSILIKLFDKRITRIVGSDKLIASISIPIADASVVGRKAEIVSWFTLRTDAMYSNTGEVEVGIKLV